MKTFEQKFFLTWDIDTIETVQDLRSKLDSLIFSNRTIIEITKYFIRESKTDLLCTFFEHDKVTANYPMTKFQAVSYALENKKLDVAQALVERFPDITKTPNKNYLFGTNYCTGDQHYEALLWIIEKFSPNIYHNQSYSLICAIEYQSFSAVKFLVETHKINPASIIFKLVDFALKHSTPEICMYLINKIYLVPENIPTEQLMYKSLCYGQWELFKTFGGSEDFMIEQSTIDEISDITSMLENPSKTFGKLKCLKSLPNELYVQLLQRCIFSVDIDFDFIRHELQEQNDFKQQEIIIALLSNLEFWFSNNVSNPESEKGMIEIIKEYYMDPKYNDELCATLCISINNEWNTLTEMLLEHVNLTDKYIHKCLQYASERTNIEAHVKISKMLNIDVPEQFFIIKFLKGDKQYCREHSQQIIDADSEMLLGTLTAYMSMYTDLTPIMYLINTYEKMHTLFAEKSFMFTVNTFSDLSMDIIDIIFRYNVSLSEKYVYVGIVMNKLNYMFINCIKSTGVPIDKTSLKQAYKDTFISGDVDGYVDFKERYNFELPSDLVDDFDDMNDFMQSECIEDSIQGYVDDLNTVTDYSTWIPIILTQMAWNAKFSDDDLQNFINLVSGTRLASLVLVAIRNNPTYDISTNKHKIFKENIELRHHLVQMFPNLYCVKNGIPVIIK